MGSTVILAVVVASTIVGDMLIKAASLKVGSVFNGVFFAGALFHALPSFGWFYLMRSHSLAEIGILYSAVTVVSLALLGAILFDERFSTRELCGLGLAIAAIALTSNRPG